MSRSPKRITIAIDGHSACGKSTLAKDLANSLEYTYIDSGAMYRAVTLYFLEHDIDIDSPTQVMQALKNISIRFDANNDGATLLNNRNVESEIRSMKVSAFVSPVAALTAVRKYLVAQQQELGRNSGVVMDGRDIGTVVFPRAELKLFLTADEQVRIDRRKAQLEGHGRVATRAEVAATISERDRIDSTRKDSPLKRAADAIVIDNTGLTREEQLEIAIKLARERIGAETEQS